MILLGITSGIAILIIMDLRFHHLYEKSIQAQERRNSLLAQQIAIARESLTWRQAKIPQASKTNHQDLLKQMAQKLKEFDREEK